MSDSIDSKANKLKIEAQQLWQQGQQQQAIALSEQICQLEPEVDKNWVQLGSLYALTGRPDLAIEKFEHAKALNPGSAEIYYDIAKALVMMSRFDTAIEYYQHALSIRPDWIQALNNLGSTYLFKGKAGAAIKCYQKILALQPDYTAAMINMCNALVTLERYDDAIEGFRRILKLNPGDPSTLSNLGSTLISLNRYDEIIDLCQHAKHYYPDSPEPDAVEAKIHARKGNWQQALKILEPLVEKHPLNYQVVATYYLIARPANKTDKAIELLENLLTKRSGQLELENLYEIHFYLGKLYDAKHQYDKAFAHIKQGNEMQPGSFNIKAHDALIDRVTETLNKAFFIQRARPSVSSTRPVFILGMPRSGTSLTEQILDCHSQVSGGGELNDINSLSKRASMLTDPETPYPESLLRLTTAELDALCAEYLQKLDKISTTSRYVTDKMPQNFLHLGFIAQLFPDAHIIRCQRNPIDTCLSCYFQDFRVSMGFSQNLETLARYYQSYERLMNHWYSVIDNPILDFHYEAVIADPEKNVRKLLEFLDLDWEDSCLSFHENKRVVATQSHDQVRQPLYNTSVERWRNYEKHIQPLLDILGTDHLASG